MTADGHDLQTCPYCDFAALVAEQLERALAEDTDLNQLRAPTTERNPS